MTTTSADLTTLIRLGFAWRLEWSGSLLAGASVRLGAVVSSAGAILQDRAFATTGDDTLFTLYRDTAWTGGVAWTPMNRNDTYWASATRAALSSAATGVTATTAAANKMGSVRLQTVGPKATSAAGEGSEIDLAPGGSYVIEVVNNSANTCEASLSLLVLRDQMKTGVLSRTP